MFDINNRVELEEVTVKELISVLQSLPEEATVCFEGSCIGYLHMTTSKNLVSFDSSALEEEYFENEVMSDNFPIDIDQFYADMKQQFKDKVYFQQHAIKYFNEEFKYLWMQAIKDFIKHKGARKYKYFKVLFRCGASDTDMIGSLTRKQVVNSTFYEQLAEYTVNYFVYTAYKTNVIEVNDTSPWWYIVDSNTLSTSTINQMYLKGIGIVRNLLNRYESKSLDLFNKREEELIYNACEEYKQSRHEVT